MMVQVNANYMTPDLLSLSQSQQEPLTQIVDEIDGLSHYLDSQVNALRKNGDHNAVLIESQSTNPAAADQ